MEWAGAGTIRSRGGKQVGIAPLNMTVAALMPKKVTTHEPTIPLSCHPQKALGQSNTMSCFQKPEEAASTAT